jgi:uncharacterized protein YkwD
MTLPRLGCCLGVLAGLVLAWASPSSVTAGGGCAHANAEPSEASLGEFRKAITCLINRERTAKGLGRVKTVARIHRVAEDHTDLMLRRDCFEHRCGGERPLERRLKREGYPRAGKFGFAENLGYQATPREMMDRFVASPSHYSTLRKAKFDDIGVGTGRGSPVPGERDNSTITYTVTLGFGH